MWGDWISVFYFCGEITKWGNPKFKLQYELAVELGKPDVFLQCHRQSPVRASVQGVDALTWWDGFCQNKHLSQQIQSALERCDSFASSKKVGRPGTREVGT